MKNQKTLFTGLRSGLFVAMTSVLISCGGGGGGSDDSSGSATDTSVAVKNSQSVIIGVLETNAAAINAVSVDSPALDSLLSSAGVTLTDTDSVGVTDDLGDFLHAALDENSADITRDGNRITVRPNVTDFCNVYATSTGIATDSEEYTACQDIMIDVRLAIDVTGDNTGTLTVSHKGNSPVHVKYSPTQLIYTVDLTGAIATLESVLTVMSPDIELDLPATVGGTIVIDIQALGKDHGSTRVNISKAINLIDNTQGINVTIDPTTLFSAEVNGVKGTANLSGSLNSISGTYPVDVGTSSAPNSVEGSLNLTSASMSLNITDAGNGMTGEVAFGPLKIRLDNTDAVNFMLDPKFSVNPDTGAITLDTALDLDMTVVDTFAYFDMFGTLQVTAPAGTSFVEVTGSSGVYKVESGSINISATGTVFSGTSGTISVGQCFDIENGLVSCP